MKKTLSIFLCILLLMLTSCGARDECNKDCKCSESNIVTDGLSTSPVIEKTETVSTVDNVSSSQITDEFDTSLVTNEVQSSLDEEIDSNLDFKNRSVDTIEQEDETIFADTLISLYLSETWDGFPTTIDGHDVSLSSYGELLVDGHLTSPSKFHSQHCLDFPDAKTDRMGDSCNMQHINGKGTYLLVDETYTKFLRGKEIKLPGGTLNWKSGEGIDTSYGHAILHYVEEYDKMFLTTPMLPYDDGSGIPTLQPIGPTYLYIFPDYDIAEIEFIGRAKELIYDEFSFRYIDENDICWTYYEKDGKSSFAKGYYK